MSRIGKSDEVGRQRDCARDPPATSVRPGARRSEHTDQSWLEARLKAIHDEVVHEPLPDSLRRLIDAIDR